MRFPITTQMRARAVGVATSNTAIRSGFVELDVTPPVLSLLKSLDQELTPIRLVAERLAIADAIIDSLTGAALISHRPKIGTEAYACVIFPGVAEEQTARYEKLQRSGGNDGFEIPDVYRSVIRRLNGCRLFGLSLYGLPASMCQSPPFLDRSAQQPLDIGTANRLWRKRYSADPTLFHFGSGPYSPTEDTAYFLKANGGVVALLRGGHEEWVWPSIETFLSQELPRAEEQFGGFESRMNAAKVTDKQETRT